MIFFGQARSVATKIALIAKTFGITEVQIPDDSAALKQQLQQIVSTLRTKVDIMHQTLAEVQKTCNFFFAVPKSRIFSRYDILRYLLNKEKQIQQVLTSIDQRGNLVGFEFWVAESEQQHLLNRIKAFHSDQPHFVEPIIAIQNPGKKKYPTAYLTNDFMQPFQDIVNTFSIPRYKEANPAVYTVATFPFFFGIMFGDVGHGLVVLTFGLYLLFNHERWKKSGSAWANVSYLRYLVTMMGLMSVYSGALYNEFVSVNMPLFKSCYTKQFNTEGDDYYDREEGCVYPFGLDYVWGNAKNEVTYGNSFKMKFAIIIGVIQMLHGICLKGANALYFNNPIDFFFEFLPQFLFMACSFGYMVVLIMAKWLTNWYVDEDKQIFKDPAPPQIISIFTSLHKVTPDLVLLGNANFQQDLQLVFMGVLFISALGMLFPKPFLLKKKYEEEARLRALHKNIDKKKIQAGSLQGSLTEKLITDSPNELDLRTTEKSDRLQSEGSVASDSHDDGDEHNFGEIFIHQVIETIEFVLGSVSNTASYLRLWALSLAHAQLSKVFLSMILKPAYENSTSPVLTAIMAVPTYLQLAGVTVGVLLVMDVMECFLHTLRLHWVEFQNKFFKGEGRPFAPFNFKFISS